MVRVVVRVPTDRDAVAQSSAAWRPHMFRRRTALGRLALAFALLAAPAGLAFAGDAKAP